MPRPRREPVADLERRSGDALESPQMFLELDRQNCSIGGLFDIDRACSVDDFGSIVLFQPITQ